MSLSGGPNFCFHSRRDFRKIAGFLGINSVKVTSVADVERVRKITNVLFGFEKIDETRPKQIGEKRWRIGVIKLANTSQYYEVEVSKTGVIETGTVRSEDADKPMATRSP